MRDKCRTEKQLYIYEVAKTSFWRKNENLSKKIKFWLIGNLKISTFFARTAHSRNVASNFEKTVNEKNNRFNSTFRFLKKYRTKIGIEHCD